MGFLKIIPRPANKSPHFCHYHFEAQSYEDQCHEDPCLKPDLRADFPALYQKYGDRIYRFCYRLSGSASDAEDLTQEVFLAAFQGAGRFEGRASVQTWLYRIALNCWRSSRRKPHLDMTPLEDAAHPGPGLEQSITDAASLTCALNALPPDLREAFLLVKAEGLTHREAAQVLDAPLGTVQFRVHQAARRLRALLTEDEDHGLKPEAPKCSPSRGRKTRRQTSE